LNVLTAAAISFVGTAVNRFNEVGSALDDMSQRTGVSVEALSQLEYATQQSATSMASLQTALIKMGSFLTAVKDGSAEANRTLSQLGLTAAQFQNMPADEQLRLFADAISRVPPGAQQSVAAMKVFGKGAVDLLPMLNAGSAGIAAMMLEADRLGITMTARSAAAAAQFGDSLDRLKATFNALIVQIGSQFGPILTDLASTFSTLLADNGDMIRNTITLVAVFGAVTIAMKAMTYATQGYAQAQAFAVALAAGPAGWAKLAVGLAAATAAASYLSGTFDQLNNKLDRQIEQNTGQQIAVAGTAREYNNATDALKQYVDAVESMAGQYEATVLPKSIALRNEIARMAFQFNEAERSGKQLALTWNEFQNLKTAKLLDGSGWTTQWRSIADELRILRGEITETELEFERMAEAGVDDRHIQALREQRAERDRLREQVDKEKADRESVAADHAARMEAERQNLIATRNEVMASFTTPLQKSVAEFAAKSKEVQAAVEAGKLDPKAAVKFLENEQKRLQAGLQGDQKQVISSAIDVTSEESNRLLVGLLNRGTSDPAAKTNSLIEQTNRHLFELKTAIANQAVETREFGS
jgi:hypothetical protein